MFYFMHATPSHYHHYAELLTYIEHIRLKFLEACVNDCWANNRVHYNRMVVFVCKSNYLIIIIMHTTFKNVCQVGTFSNVCLRLTQLSQLSFMQYIGHCVFSLPSYDDCEKTCIVRKRAFHRVIIIKSEAWPIYHCLGLGHGIMVCAVCLYILMDTHLCKWELFWQETYVIIRR